MMCGGKFLARLLRRSVLYSIKHKDMGFLAMTPSFVIARPPQAGVAISGEVNKTKLSKILHGGLCSVSFCAASE
jgi:hypothetical protein